MLQLETEEHSLENIAFNIRDIFGVCQALTEQKAEEKGITLYFYAEPSVVKTLVGDPSRLRQALLNLLSNAVKFTSNGIVQLLASREECTENSLTIRFEVKDSGIGMSNEQIAKILEPITQAELSTQGLAVTRNIIELMGGKIMAESAPGIGSKFSFILTFETVDSPLAVCESAAPAQSPAKPINEESAEKRHRMRLKINFYNDNKTTLEDIAAAIRAEDITLAHRLAHTLGSVAGLLEKDMLMKAARDVEASLKSDKPKVTEEQMDSLKHELNNVLNELSPLIDEEKTYIPATELLSDNECFALLDKLEPLLSDNDIRSINFTDNLRGIPGADDLIEQIEELDFKQALQALKSLKRILRKEE